MKPQIGEQKVARTGGCDLKWRIEYDWWTVFFDQPTASESASDSRSKVYFFRFDTRLKPVGK